MFIFVQIAKQPPQTQRPQQEPQQPNIPLLPSSTVSTTASLLKSLPHVVDKRLVTTKGNEESDARSQCQQLKSGKLLAQQATVSKSLSNNQNPQNRDGNVVRVFVPAINVGKYNK